MIRLLEIFKIALKLMRFGASVNYWRGGGVEGWFSIQEIKMVLGSWFLVTCNIYKIVTYQSLDRNSS